MIVGGAGEQRAVASVIGREAGGFTHPGGRWQTPTQSRRRWRGAPRWSRRGNVELSDLLIELHDECFRGGFLGGRIGLIGAERQQREKLRVELRDSVFYCLGAVEWLEHVAVEGAERRGVLLAGLHRNGQHQAHQEKRQRGDQRDLVPEGQVAEDSKGSAGAAGPERQLRYADGVVIRGHGQGRRACCPAERGCGDRHGGSSL